MARAWLFAGLAHACGVCGWVWGCVREVNIVVGGRGVGRQQHPLLRRLRTDGARGVWGSAVVLAGAMARLERGMRPGGNGGGGGATAGTGGGGAEKVRGGRGPGAAHLALLDGGGGEHGAIRVGDGGRGRAAVRYRRDGRAVGAARARRGSAREGRG